MNVRTSSRALAIIALLLAAGASTPVIAQTPIVNPARQAGSVATTIDFRSAKWLCDRRVVNNNGEDIASVADLILDRGSGHIQYVVIKSGTTFGLGGRTAAIPYSSFQWEAGGKERFVLGATAEQLKEYPEYSPESWKAMQDPTKDDKAALRLKLAADAESPGDPYAGNLVSAKSARVEGTITKVERVRTSTFGEQVVISVEPADKAIKRIALGPSWYINGTPSAPMRGDKVVVETLVLPRDSDELLVGTEIRGGEHKLQLRATDGTPAWALKSIESGGRKYSTPYSRFLVLSNINGMKVDCRGNECGTVNDIIIDRTSGEIAFLSIDPNENFLGIRDTKRLLPWSVATVTVEGTVRIDASKEMVLASPETPTDLSTLNSGTHAERVYKAFEVPSPRFEVPPPISAVPHQPGTDWSQRGPIIGAIESNSIRTMEGKVIDFTDVKFEKGVQGARAIRILVPGENTAETTVLLGPAWYMDNQKPVCEVGDSIRVEVCRTMIDGEHYWMARSIDCKAGRVVLLDTDNAPAWAQP